MDEEAQDFFEGVLHALCATVDALEEKQPGARQAVITALEAKIGWLETHNAAITKAAMVLTLRDWLMQPPGNPADPYGAPSARILQFRPRRPS